MEPDVKNALADLESLKAWAEGGDRVEAADIEAVINILNPPKPSQPDSAWDRINRGDDDELKVIDVHMPSGRAIKTLIPIKHFSVAPPVINLQTPGQEPEPKPDRCSGLEYVEGPPPTWVTSMKVSENPYYGDKPLKTFAGRDLR